MQNAKIRKLKCSQSCHISIKPKYQLASIEGAVETDSFVNIVSQEKFATISFIFT